MDIPNLSSSVENTTPVTSQKPSNSIFNLKIVIVIVIFGLISGFALSKVTKNNPQITSNSNSDTSKAVSADQISSTSDLVVGKLYGNSEKAFKDTATGTIEKGSINGEGTHILNRPGGSTQRASLTSSAVDLDLFVGKKVEVKGETNASTKTSWLLDVGSIKILE